MHLAWFFACLQTGIDIGKDEPGMTLPRLERRVWVDYMVEGKVVTSPIDIDSLPAGRYRLVEQAAP